MYINYMFNLVPTQDASHRQDDITSFMRESQAKPPFATNTGKGDNANCVCVCKYNVERMQLINHIQYIYVIFTSIFLPGLLKTSHGRIGGWDYDGSYINLLVYVPYCL